MDALDPNAYAAFQASSNLQDVVDRVMKGGGVSGGAIKPGMTKALSVRASIMTPVKPMLVRFWLIASSSSSLSLFQSLGGGGYRNGVE